MTRRIGHFECGRHPCAALLFFCPVFDGCGPAALNLSGEFLLDEEQVRLFLAEARRSPTNYCLYLTAILARMRQGELLGLRWSDIDFLLGSAPLQQTIYRLGDAILFKKPKIVRGRRSVSLPPSLIDSLQEHRQRQAEYHNLDLEFCQPSGKPLHAHNIAQGDFREAIRRAGLPRIRFTTYGTPTLPTCSGRLFIPK